MKRRGIVLLVLISITFALMGCQKEADSQSQQAIVTEPASAEYENLTITGGGILVTLNQEDMKVREQETITCKTIDSKEQVKELTIEGFSLEKILEENGTSQKDFSSIRFVSADGYSIMVPAEIFTKKDIYIVLKEDNKELTTPRSAIPDERSMYWAKELVSIELEKGENAVSKVQTDSIYLFREGCQSMQPVKMMLGKEETSGYSIQDFCNTYLGEQEAQDVFITGEDGFKKTEKSDVLLQDYVTLDDSVMEEVPRIWSEKSNQGMHIKQAKTAVFQNKAIYFGTQITLKELGDSIGLKDGAAYILTASDGFSVEVPKEAYEYGTLSYSEEDGMKISFDGIDLSSVKGKGNVKHLISIQVK